MRRSLTLGQLPPADERAVATVTFYSPDRRHVADARPRPPADDVTRPARDARFSRWDGSQSVPDLTADEIVEALADDLLEEGDVAEALRRLMERGWRSGDPIAQRPAGTAGPPRAPAAAARGAAGAARPGRSAG